MHHRRTCYKLSTASVWSCAVFATAAVLIMGNPCGAAEPPDYATGVLGYVYPAGGQRGTTVQVRFGVGYERNGRGSGGDAVGADDVVVEGPPGVTTRDVKASKNTVTATLEIADDASLGRRMVRVKNGPAGLTSFRWFVVGGLPEFVEKENNNTPDTANTVATPVVVNGRVQQTLDLDYFRFQGKKGQSIVAAVQAHALDVIGFGRKEKGFADLSMELLDETGRVIASAKDTVGFDPLFEHALPADGWYTVRVAGMGYRGFPEAVYRLTLGDVGYVTSVFPPGGRRGDEVEVELAGLNLPENVMQRIAVSETGRRPLQYVVPDKKNLVAHDLAFIRGDLPETVESESNDEPDTATPIELGSVVNGRFARADDVDCYKLDLKKGQRVKLEIIAQRHLRSPVDTFLAVFNAEGEKIQENDDGKIFEGPTTHDFQAFDSYLSFTATKDGPFFVQVTEQTGSFGPRAMYRLACQREQPDFRLYHWPDSVPVWGPGSSSSFIIEVIRSGRLKADIDVAVEGLPEGWEGSATVSKNGEYRGPRGALGTKVLLTVTAPKNAKVGDLARFHVVGRAEQQDRKIEHRSQPLNIYLWGGQTCLRVSPSTRAVVARPQAMMLRTDVRQVIGAPGETIQIPVTVEHANEELEEFGLVFSRGRSHHKAGYGGAPVTFQAGQTNVKVPLIVSENAKPGEPIDVVIAQQWRNNFRNGLPGPCTHLVRIDVQKTVKEGDK